VGGADLLGKWVLVDRPFSYLCELQYTGWAADWKGKNTSIVCFGLVVISLLLWLSLVFLLIYPPPQFPAHLLFNSSYPVSYSSCRLALPSCFQIACTVIPSSFSQTLDPFFIVGSPFIEYFVL